MAHPPGGAHVDHGPDVGGLIEGIPHTEGRDGLPEEVQELLESPVFDIDALHRYAALSGVAVAGLGADARRVGQVGIAAHDGGRVATQLEDQPLAGRELSHPAPGGGASREGDRAHLGSPNQGRAQLGASVQQLDRGFRHARIEQDADDQRARAGRLRGRLDDRRVAGRE